VETPVAKGKTLKIDSVLLGILALVAGISLLAGWLSANLVIGVWLLIFGILTLLRRA
jgi:hypothetical protein